MDNDKRPHAVSASVNPAASSSYAEVNGIKMYYEQYGNKGDRLVLIHGGGSTIGTSFGRIIPFLAKDHRLIAVELQGHGHTSTRKSQETFEQDADDVAALLSNLKISKASFFGFSNGGTTAMQIAVRHPEMVNKLVIASALFKRNGMQPGFFDAMPHATLKDMPQSLQKAFLDITPDSAKLMEMFTQDRDRMIHFKDWSDEVIKSVIAPVLIIAGDHDVTTNAHAMELANLIPNARLMILPATHGSYIGEIETPADNGGQTEMTAEIIRQFLSKGFGEPKHQ